MISKKIMFVIVISCMGIYQSVHASNTTTQRSSVAQMNFDSFVSAIKAGKLDAVKSKLSDVKEMINSEDKKGMQPLDYAMLNYQQDPATYRLIIRELFKAGADLPVKGALYWDMSVSGVLQEEEKNRGEIQKGKAQRPQTQPKSRPSYEGANKDFVTAVKALDLESIKKALSAGVDPDQKVSTGVSALVDISARNMGDIDSKKQLNIVVELLKKTKKFANESLRAASRAGWNVSLIKPLIDAGADINAKGTSGKTALMLVAETMVKNYLDPKVHNEGALERYNRKFAQELIKQGANVDALDAVIDQNPTKNARLKKLREMYPVG